MSPSACERRTAVTPDIRATCAELQPRSIVAIEIDAGRQSTKVAAITGSDYFQDLRSRAAELRRIVGHEEDPGNG